MLNFIKRYWPTALATLILLTALTGVYAKYVMDQALTGQASITAKLGSISVLEHVYELQTDGSYKKTEATTNNGNTYSVVIPGLDIPKDPYVQITDKTPIPVYVFVEVCSALDDSVLTYEVDTDNWLKVEDLTGQNNGTVYVYAPEGSAATVTSNLGPVYILEGNQVIVGQKLNKNDTSDLTLSFYATMAETAIGKPDLAYKTANGMIS